MTEPIVLDFERLPALGAAYRRGLLARKPGLKEGSTIPPISARVRSVRLDAEVVRRYRSVCGFTDGASVPITYPQVLANSIHAEMILAPAFPAKPLRIIHRGVRIDARAPLPLDAEFTMSGHVEGHRTTRHGIEIEFLTDVAVDGEVLWSSTSTVLLKQGGGSSASRVRPVAELGEPPGRMRSTVWRLPADLGRVYAGVTHDYNPIHLWPLTAKLFGFKRPIIHGAWSLARCVAELDRDLADVPVRVEAQFKRPIFLPGQVLFTAAREAEGLQFALRSRDGSKPHLVGRAEPL